MHDLSAQARGMADASTLSISNSGATAPTALAGSFCWHAHKAS